MEPIKEAFRGVILQTLRPVEDKEGVRIGEDVRVHKEKDGAFVVRFLKGTDEKRRKAIRDKLAEGKVKYKEAKDYAL